MGTGKALTGTWSRMEKPPPPGKHNAAKGKHYHDVSRCRNIWPRSTVLRILDDERYIGTYAMGKRKVTEVGSRHVRMKEESEWFKILHHHLVIVSKELFEQAHGQRQRTTYLSAFITKWTKVSPAMTCGLRKQKLKAVLYETLFKQAMVILNLDDLSNAGVLDVQLAKQAEYNRQIREYDDKKCALYEQLLLQEINVEEYKEQKALIAN